MSKIPTWIIKKKCAIFDEWIQQTLFRSVSKRDVISVLKPLDSSNEDDEQKS